MMQPLTQEERKKLKAIANRIKELRIKKGYSSYDHFAWENKLSKATYANAEQGKNITLATLMRILKVHDMSIEEFFVGLSNDKAKKK